MKDMIPWESPFWSGELHEVFDGYAKGRDGKRALASLGVWGPSDFVLVYRPPMSKLNELGLVCTITHEILHKCVACVFRGPVGPDDCDNVPHEEQLEATEGLDELKRLDRWVREAVAVNNGLATEEEEDGTG